MIARIQFGHFRVWAPLFLLWALFLPIALLLMPLFFVLCWATQINPFVALKIFWNVLISLRGTRIEVSQPRNSFLISIT